MPKGRGFRSINYDEIAFDAKTALEDCSDGWDKIYAVIDNHSAQLLDEKTTKEEE